MSAADEERKSLPMTAHVSPRHDGEDSPTGWQLSKEDWDEYVNEIKELRGWVWGDREKEIKGAHHKLEVLHRFYLMTIGAAMAIGAVGGYLVNWLRGDK